MGIIKKIKEKYKKAVADLTENIGYDSVQKIIESMLLIALADGMDENEEKLIIKNINELWKLESENEIIEILKNIDKDKIDIEEQFIYNINELTKNLGKKQKKQLIDLFIELIQADKYVTDIETKYLKLLRQILDVKQIFKNTTCDKCNSQKKLKFIGYNELDRWKGRKQVFERTASGKIKSKWMTVTFVLIRNNYQCPDCYSKSHSDVKTEL